MEYALRAQHEEQSRETNQRQRLELRRDSLLEQRKNLGRELVRGILDSNTYQELREEIDADLADVRVTLAETTRREIDVEGVAVWLRGFDEIQGLLRAA